MDLARDLPCGCTEPRRHLTDREAEVLTLAAADLHDREISTVLGISTRTVQQHIASMLRKADVRSRGGLIAWCYALGVLDGSEVWPPRWSRRRCLAPTESSNRTPRRSGAGGGRVRLDVHDCPGAGKTIAG